MVSNTVFSVSSRLPYTSSVKIIKTYFRVSKKMVVPHTKGYEGGKEGSVLLLAMCVDKTLENVQVLGTEQSCREEARVRNGARLHVGHQPWIPRWRGLLLLCSSKHFLTHCTSSL